jgi:xanthine dehydrogenase FAD-binding subunit
MVFFPTTLDELLNLLNQQPDARIMAGGTDLLVALRHAGKTPRQIIGLERIPALAEIHEQPDGGVSIGVCVSFSSIVRSQLLQQRYPLLTQAAVTVGGPAIRNMATIGGNIATASPASDSLPALYLLGAMLELRSNSGTRLMAITDFITGPRRTQLGSYEIISRIMLPPQPDWTIQRFEKVGRRKSLAIAVASLAAAIRLAEDGTVLEARLAWGSVGPTIICCPAAEAILQGQLLSEQSLAHAAECARETVCPIDDIRASAAYRREVAGNLLYRLAI